jgi:transcription-repair coupling factor (superfamily II helicase)
MSIFSGIPHPTAPLFLSGNFVDTHKQVCLIVDDAKIWGYIEEVGSWIWGHPIRVLHHPGEVIALWDYNEKVIVINSDLLRISGNLETIRRAHTYAVTRESHVGQNILIEKLLEYGYHQSDYPGESGTYKREGSIIRIWREDREYLIEYFDDTIESIVEISPRGRAHRDSFMIFSLHPYTSDGALPISEILISTIRDMPTLLIGCEFLRERECLLANIRDIIEFSSMTREGSIKLDIERVAVETLPAFLEYIQTQTDRWIISVTRYEKRLREFLDINNSSHLSSLEYRHIRESFSLIGNTEHLGEKWQKYIKNDTFSLLSDDIFGQVFVQNRTRKTTIKNLDLLLKIRAGDLIVHREHGIGRYIQILRKRIGLIEREYMEVEYRNADKVFVPMTELARITKYVWWDDTELSNLEGKEWEKTLSKTDKEVEEIAEDILSTDAKRSLTTRIAFGSFPVEEEKFLHAFAYTHTADQLSIIEDIHADMENPHPMDRLIAWDVGFGKTEIAMNAIYKAVLSGVQVAVISPLLILAEEHRETFEERLWAFWVRVRSLTRMTHAREVKIILEEMRLGKVDVVVGTHRLLSEDIRFRRLGLLVIDEEHRFWVVQKEAIKKMKSHVDILSLSATPIPRSLHLALSGLKKISLLTTPPSAKKPIDTIVTRWEEHTVKNAILTELTRGWQVIILHNRVRSLPMIEREIEELLRHPEWNEGFSKYSKNLDSSQAQNDDTKRSPRIITTHGQMNPDDIEDRILAFKQRKYDILISTTVIENGVNFLGANTIIISDAEEFGLAQLHQIRGRVGRRDIAWVCYLLYRKYELSGEERERLMILAEHSALGSGYEIAMRDMQMRGTGDILGWRQSGKTKEVGISLYFQLLEEKIETMKHGKKEKNTCKIDLELSYIISDEIFDSEMDKLSFFRDIESIETLEDLDITESTFEMDEGDESMQNLFLMMRSSIILGSYWVTRVSKMGSYYHFDFSEGTTPAALRAFLERFDSGHEMIIVSVTKIKVEVKNWKDTRGFLIWLTW